MTVNVKDLGAIGDGATDDRAAFEKAFATNDVDIYVPNGRYLLSQTPHTDFCIAPRVPGTSLRGQSRDGVVLVQAVGLPGSVRTIRCGVPGIRVSCMTGDGNKANQTPDEHRCFVFAQNAQDLFLLELIAKNHTGDGIYIYDRSTASVHSVVCQDNDRNGLTMGGGTSWGKVCDSVFKGNRAEQFDTEGGIVTNMILMGNKFVGAENDYALTISGASPTALSSEWLVENNTIDGGIAVVWASGIILRGNKGNNVSRMPSLTLYRTTKKCIVEGNNFMSSNLVTNSAIVMVTGTGTGSGSSEALIIDNELGYNGPLGTVFGIRAEGAVSLEICHNSIRGPAVAARGYAGIYLRATNQDEDWELASVSNNTISDWGDLGLRVDGNGTAKMRKLTIESNVWGNDITPASMVSAMQLNESNNPTNAAKLVRHSSSTLQDGCVELLRKAPGGAHSSLGDLWSMP
jgi:hypothetical protein